MVDEVEHRCGKSHKFGTEGEGCDIWARLMHMSICRCICLRFSVLLVCVCARV